MKARIEQNRAPPRRRAPQQTWRRQRSASVARVPAGSTRDGRAQGGRGDIANAAAPEAQESGRVASANCEGGSARRDQEATRAGPAKSSATGTREWSSGASLDRAVPGAGARHDRVERGREEAGCRCREPTASTAMCHSWRAMPSPPARDGANPQGESEVTLAQITRRRTERRSHSARQEERFVASGHGGGLFFVYFPPARDTDQRERGGHDSRASTPDTQGRPRNRHRRLAI